MRTLWMVLVSIALPSVIHAEPADKVSICHVPPGNPGNAHTIVVSGNATEAHLAHGDTLGACETGPPSNCQTWIDGQTADVLIVPYTPVLISVDEPTVESVAITNLNDSHSVDFLLSNGEVWVEVTDCDAPSGFCLGDSSGITLPVFAQDLIEAAGVGCEAATATIDYDDD